VIRDRQRMSVKLGIESDDHCESVAQAVCREIDRMGCLPSADSASWAETLWSVLSGVWNVALFMITFATIFIHPQVRPWALAWLRPSHPADAAASGGVGGGSEALAAQQPCADEVKEVDAGPLEDGEPVEAAESSDTDNDGQSSTDTVRCGVASCSKVLKAKKFGKISSVFQRNSIRRKCQGCKGYFCKDHVEFFNHPCADNMADQPSKPKPASKRKSMSL